MIAFNNGKKEQAGKSVDKENTIVYMADIPIEQNNNCFLFKNNMEYAWQNVKRVNRYIF